MPEQPYNPLDKRQLGESVANELERRQIVPLGSLTPFEGAGVYALYYDGPLAAYAELRQAGRPIYVGKAIPSGGRKGMFQVEAPPGQALFSRLSKHAESIRRGHGLDIGHFTCRYLVVDDIWIPLGETLLITKWRPPWNSPLDGFGNNDPGSGRYQGERSIWDTIHPGRPWAQYLRVRGDARELLETWRPGDDVPIPERIATPEVDDRGRRRRTRAAPDLPLDEPLVAESPPDDEPPDST